MSELLSQENPVQPQQIQSYLMEKNSTSKRTLWVSILILLFLSSAVVTFALSQKSNQVNNDPLLETKQENTGSISPSPIPFAELTVPYLRSRKYTSSLQKRELYAENGNYTSYLTSYESDGLKVNGLLTIPTGDEPENGWPAVVFIHGYLPPTTYQTAGSSYADYVDYIARNGFVVFKIDLRGHGDSEGEPGGGYYGSDYVVDALNARAALQNADFVNKDAVGMWGHSMAGNIIMRSMVVKPEIPAGVIWAVAVYSYTDMQKYGIDDNSYRPPQNNTERQQRRRELFEKYGSPSAQSEFWQQVAPINYVKDIKGAIEVHHAIDDDVVNVGYSRDLMAAFDKTNVKHQLFEYQTGGHNITGTSFNQAMQRTVAFFTETLNK